MTPQKVFPALIDTCVMERYFRAHMAERNLLFLDSVAETILSRSFPIDPQTGVSALLSLKATSHHPIHDRLLRISSDSPDLLAIIKQEGKA